VAVALAYRGGKDEDRVIEHILSAVIDTDDKKKRTVAELLALAYSNEVYAQELLERLGIRIINAQGRACLAIATQSDALERLLKDTPYASGYDAQIRRNPLCLNPEKTVRERMAGRMLSARLIDWVRFKEGYMEEGKE
jgi:hypothetical protein